MTGLALGLAALAMAAPCPPASVPAPPAHRPAYALVVHVHRGLYRVDGTETVSFRPAVATDRVVLRLWANGPAFAGGGGGVGASLDVRDLTSRGRPMPVARPNRTTLVVRRRLAAGQTIVLRLRWSLLLPPFDGGRMHGGDTMRLASFFPLL